MDNNLFRTYLILISFLSIIAFPLLNSYFHVIKDIDSFENRAMVKKPEFQIEFLDPFPVKYENYYTDNFNLRNRYILYFNLYKFKAFRLSPIKTVFIGDEGWLFLNSEEMDSYMGKNRLTEIELKSIQLELECRKNYFTAKGIKFYFLVVPCKASIYGEYIGFEYLRFYNDSWGEQLISYLKKNSSVNTISVFDSLRTFKKNQNLYSKLDNHWNDLGAFYTANEVFKNMRSDFTALEILSLDDYNCSVSEGPTGNLNKMLGNLDVFKESNVILTSKKGLKSFESQKSGYPPPHGFPYPWEYEKVRSNKDTTQPGLLIISDSFGGAIFPFLSENFGRSVKIFDSWKYELHKDIITNENPDVVLLMINEPIIRSLLNVYSCNQLDSLPNKK